MMPPKSKTRGGDVNAAKQLHGIPEVTECAIQGRLCLLEGASLKEQRFVLESGLGIAAEVIRGEVANARRLSQEAHRMIMHPGRQAMLGLRAPKQRRDRHHGQFFPPRPFAKIGGEYWLMSQDVYYVVDNGRVVAAERLTQNQLNTIEGFGDLPGPDEPLVSILDLVRQSLEELPESGIQLIPSSREPESQRIISRSALPIPRWMKRAEAEWTLLVLDDDEHVVASVRRVHRWMRKEFRNVRPEPVFADRSRGVIVDVKDALRKTRYLRSSDIPKLCGVNWYGAPLTASALRWWNRMFRHVSPAHGKLVMLVTPDMARRILAVIDDAPRSAWRTNPSSVSHGHAFRIAWNQPTSRFAIAAEEF